MPRWLALVPVLVFAGLALALGLGLRRDPSAIPSALIGRPAPELVLEPIMEQTPNFRVEQFKGRVVLLNVFGSWCGACKVEHPTLVELAHKRAVAIYGVDWKDDPDACRRLLAATGNPYTGLGGDPSGRAAIDLGVTGAPETFVIDKAGRIRFKQVGPITEDVWSETLRPLVERLEAES